MGTNYYLYKIFRLIFLSRNRLPKEQLDALIELVNTAPQEILEGVQLNNIVSNNISNSTLDYDLLMNILGSSVEGLESDFETSIYQIGKFSNKNFIFRGYHDDSIIEHIVMIQILQQLGIRESIVSECRYMITPYDFSEKIMVCDYSMICEEFF